VRPYRARGRETARDPGVTSLVGSLVPSRVSSIRCACLNLWAWKTGRSLVQRQVWRTNFLGRDDRLDERLTSQIDSYHGVFLT